MKTDDELLEELVTAKPFELLNESEKALVFRLLGSEDAYHTLRSISCTLVTLASASSEEPAADILPSLKNKFRSKYRSPSLVSVITGFKVPAYAALIFVAIIIMFQRQLPLSPTPDMKQTVATSPIVHDTTYVTRIDTVYQERKVIEYIRVSLPDPVIITAASHSEKGRGVNMKEKEELNNLLVSGMN